MHTWFAMGGLILKSVASFIAGVPVRFRFGAPIEENIIMNHDNAPLEIHVHGDVPVKTGTDIKAIQEALKPLWDYAGARSWQEGAVSLYEEEPGIRFDASTHRLNLCWTVRGDEDFRMVMDDLCMNLNDLSAAGTQIEVTFYDTEFDDEDEAHGGESRDDFVMMFVGPDPAAIMQAQRDLLVHDVVNMMERHFDGAQLSGVVTEIDKLFSQRFDSLVSSLELGKPPRGSGGASGHGGSGGGRRPRHLH